MAKAVAKEQGGEGDELKHFLLWAGMLTAPIAWSIQFLIIYALVMHVCKVQNARSLHLTSVVFIAIGIAAGILSWWNTMQAAEGIEEERESTLFLGRLGLLTSAMFTLIMIAQVIPTFFIDPCWQ
jgi:hypothetical protein